MKPKKWLRVTAVILLFSAFAAVGLCVRMWGVGLVRVSGTSMNNTLKSGDIVLVTRFDYIEQPPQMGDVVECRFPGRDDVYIKRVVGLPGDRVVLRGGFTTVNGFPVSEPYVSSAAEDYEITLKANQYLLLGDNRAESYDSRMDDIGPVGADAFLGRVRLIVWPLARFGGVQ